MPLVAFCGGKKDKIKPMAVGRWKEVKRMKPDSSVVPFADTLFMAFQRNDSFTYNTRNGFVYTGKYTLNEDSLLDFGTARYTLVQRKKAFLCLSDIKGIYVFTPDSSDTAKIIVLEKEDSVRPVKNIDQMIGRWTVYKRTSDGPIVLDGDNMIRSVVITGASTDGKLGFIFSSKDPTNAPSWFVKNYGSDQVLVCDGKTNKSIKVLRCQKGEMILEDEGIKYYFKQFK